MDDEPFPGRWVRIMADSCADGVWDRNGCSDVADALPIPESLVARIRAWQAWYDKQAPDGTPDSPHADWNVQAFAAEGLAIARAVKAALGAEWTVVYFDESRASNPRSFPHPSCCEYEIGG